MAQNQQSDPYTQFGGHAEPSDPYAEFGGSVQASGLPEIPRRADGTIGAEPRVFNLPVGPFPGGIPLSTLEKGMAALPWITGATGAVLGGPAGAAIGGAGGMALGDLTLKLAGAQPPQETPAASVIVQNAISKATGRPSGADVQLPGWAHEAERIGSMGAGQGLLEGASKALSPVLKPIGKAISDALDVSAQRSMQRALLGSGGTAGEKRIAQGKLIPGLMDRGVVSPSRKALMEKATAESGKFGEQIGDYLKALPPGTKVDTDQIAARLDDVKNGFMDNGVVWNEPAYNAVNAIQEKLKAYGPQMSIDSIRNVKGIVGDIVAGAKGTGFYEPTAAAYQNAQKDFYGAMRAALAKDHPDLAQLNAEYSFWEGVQDQLGRTISKTQGQRGLIRSVATVVAGGGGFAAHSPLEAGIGAAGTYVLMTVFDSAGWKMASAQVKDRLAKAIANGSTPQILTISARIIGAGQSISATRGSFRAGGP